MKAFLALVAKQGPLDPDLLALVPALATQALAFRGCRTGLNLAILQSTTGGL